MVSPLSVELDGNDANGTYQLVSLSILICGFMLTIDRLRTYLVTVVKRNFKFLYSNERAKITEKWMTKLTDFANPLMFSFLPLSGSFHPATGRPYKLVQYL